MWTPLTRILLIGVAFSFARMLIGATSALYLLSRGLTLPELGLLKTLQAALIGVLDLPSAYLADKFGRKPAIVSAIFFATAWLLTTAFAQTTTHLYIGEVFNSISLAAFSGAFIAYLIDCAKNLAGIPARDIIARYQKWSFFAMGAGAFVGSLGGSSSNIPWMAAGATCAVLCVLAFATLPSFAHPDSDAGPIGEPKLKSLRRIFVSTSPGYVRLLISVTIFMLFYQCLIQFWQPLLAGAAPKDDVGGLLGIAFLLILWIQSLASHMVEQPFISYHLGAVSAMVCGLVLVLVVGAHAGCDWLIIPSMLLMFWLNRVHTTIAQGALHDQVSASFRATFESGLSTLVRLSLLFAMPVSGFLVEWSGATFFAAALVACVAVVIVLVSPLLRPAHLPADR